MWRAGQIQIERYISEFGWWAPLTLPHTKNFWEGIQYGSKTSEGRTDDRHILIKNSVPSQYSYEINFVF